MTKDPLAYNVLKEIGFTLLAEGKTISVRAEGFSMYPSVKPGSVIFIEPYEKGAEPVPGEIIAWKKDPGFIVHRLVRSYEEGNRKYFITRGDSIMAEDEPVPSDQIAGRVVRVENHKGKAVTADVFLRKKPNYSFNRFLVRIILQFSRVKRIFYPPSPLKGGN
jgi:signal peptidase I